MATTVGVRSEQCLNDVRKLRTHFRSGPVRWHSHLSIVRDLLAERGIIVSHEAIRQWCTKFGAAFASGLRRRRARPGDKWHLDEVLLKICGKCHWLWRAVDQNGVVLDHPGSVAA